MKTIDLDQAEQLVLNTRFASWDGWTLVIADDRYDGFYRTNGVFKNGKWMTQSVFSPNTEGNYVVPNRLKKFIPSSQD